MWGRPPPAVRRPRCIGPRRLNRYRSAQRARSLPPDNDLTSLLRFTSSLHFFAAVFPLPALLPFLSSRSNTAATIKGSPTVASTNTSPNLPPSAGGTNFPH